MTIRSINTSGLPQGVLDTVDQLLFDAGQVGGNLPFSDFSKIWQDSAGTTPYTAVEQYVGKIIDKSPNALAFTQATSAARPVVSARVNLIGNTETLTGWTGAGVAMSISGATPWGSTEFKITEDYSTGGHNATFIQFPVVSVAKYTVSAVTKSAGRNSANIQALNYFISSYAAFDLTTLAVITADGGITNKIATNISNGWVKLRFDTTKGIDGAGGNMLVQPTMGASFSYTGDGVSGIYFAEPSVCFASRSHLPFQSVTSSSVYNTVGFPHYLKFDGIDDNIVSAAGGSGTAGIYFCGAIQFNKVGAVQTIFSDTGTNSGYKLRLTAANQLEISAGNGTAYTAINTTDTFAVGDVALCEFWDDGTNIGVRLGEGTLVTVARPVVAAGTAQITIGKDNNAASSYAGINMFEPVWRYGAMPNQTQREAIRAICRAKARLQ